MYARTNANRVSIFFLKLTFYWPWVLLYRIMSWTIYKIRQRKYSAYDNVVFEDDTCTNSTEENDEQIQEEVNRCFEHQDIPEMQQIFNLGPDTVLGIQYVSFCPDETAFIRIIGDASFSNLYKRRVYYYRDDRYININGQKFYLNSNKTAPIDPEQAKEGK